MPAFTPKRLAAPTVQLSGHQGEIYSIKFSPCGEYLASAGHDRQIYFWDVFPDNAAAPGENALPRNIGVLKTGGHKNGILEL